MSDYIKREDAINVLQKVNYISTNTFLRLASEVDAIPSAEVVPKDSDEASVAYAEGWKNGEEAERSRRKKGKWLDEHEDGHGYWVGTCGVCGKTNKVINFCPNCGADMRGEQ